MKRFYRRLAAAALLLLWLPAGALALTGQSFSTFQTYYREDISFINDVEGRHQLPIELETLDLNDNGRTQYQSYSDALNVTIAVDAAGIIERCEIRLLFPKGAAEGNSLYLDYIAANYQSIAFIMSMNTASTPDSRFLLAKEIRSALEDNFGAYERQLGSYTISCVSVVGEGAVFTFTNNGLAPAATEEPAGADAPADEQNTPTEINEDEAANYG